MLTSSFRPPGHAVHLAVMYNNNNNNNLRGATALSIDLAGTG